VEEEAGEREREREKRDTSDYERVKGMTES
jgi:hypothetical protein